MNKSVLITLLFLTGCVGSNYTEKYNSCVSDTVNVDIDMNVRHYFCDRYAKGELKEKIIQNLPTSEFCNQAQEGCYNHYEQEYKSHNANWTTSSSQHWYSECYFIFCEDEK